LTGLTPVGTPASVFVERGRVGGLYASAMSGQDATEPDVAQQDTERTFDRLVDEGRQRLGRSWSGVISTGLLGGLDVGVGVLALLLVEHATESKVLGGLAFSIGFIALTLARSELFTEDFLVPVAAVVSKASTLLSLLRLWGVTIVTNLAGGWLITGIIIVGFPSLRSTAVDSAAFYIDLGITWRAFALALMGGFLITLMTHMQHSTDSDGVRLVPAIVMGFLLGAGQVNHAIVASLLCFAGLHAGGPFGYADWLGLFAFAALGNMIGGLGLVTVLRLLQVPHKIAAERRDNPAQEAT
jgi:formate/nitrite transporter FocA (FNT family)